ncbi:hypothetical protein [Photobacterium sp. OFAV2-7]|uniref:hypothetical protein n=1 Tax=Photobacterium sp. OFAV2-7 TaxID=2917748 RepID=UPI001EF71E5B|nr:hypothetical protein [Photobacterium sp. OFAV2-7]MCG7584430.1 hypothetical protein [Photobacterium sp. OFAV2-7]
MKKEQVNRLQSNFKGQRQYSAKNEAFTFDIFEDIWQLDTKVTIYLSWMYEAGYDEQTFIDIRVGLANVAKKQAPNSIKRISNDLKVINNSLTLEAFKIRWMSLSARYKVSIAATLAVMMKHGKVVYFNKIYKYASDNRPTINSANNILDPTKGAYSEVEYDSITEQLYLATNQLPDYCKNITELNQYRVLIACHLMIATVRRPTQLVQSKWCDLLPVGQSFTNQRLSKGQKNWLPLSEPLFSDIERLHFRTFKGKSGTFRTQAEKTSHLLEPDLSTLIGRYYRHYEKFLIEHLKEEGIELTDDERREIMMRCPIISDESLFEMKFVSKSNLFKAIGVISNIGHSSSVNLYQMIANCFNNLETKSDRVHNKKLKLGNNRLRHTVLTQGAAMGLTRPFLAQITGVRESSVTDYIDLNVAERVQINQAFADNEVLNRFGKTPVQALLQEEGFAVKNEFDEEIGIQSNPSNCVSCNKKLGAPMACYPCDNFRPLDNAEHQQYLDKAVLKYELNKANGDAATVRSLRIIILYITATIKVCEKIKVSNGGGCHDGD